MPQMMSRVRFGVDHVLPRKHGGDDSIENLALCCLHCNLHKGSNLSGIDPIAGRVVTLFNPRKDNWLAHFRWDNAHLIGVTACGRATITVLNINSAERLQLRETMIAEGVFQVV